MINSWHDVGGGGDGYTLIISGGPRLEEGIAVICFFFLILPGAVREFSLIIYIPTLRIFFYSIELSICTVLTHIAFIDFSLFQCIVHAFLYIYICMSIHARIIYNHYCLMDF